MNKKTIIISTLIIFMLCAAVGAAEYRFTYKKGKVDVNQNTIKAGKDSAFAISYGTACELRCGPDSVLEINAVTKTGESVFTLKSGACFIRIIDDTSGARVMMNTPFVVLKSSAGAFYAGCAEKAASVYDGSARIEFKKSMAKLTTGRTYKDGKIIENQPDTDLWKEWNFNRDKTDIFMKLQADKKAEERIKRFLADALAKSYGAGKISFTEETEPQDLTAAIKISENQDELMAAGIISSELSGTAGIINLSRKIEEKGNPYESSMFMPFIYEAAAVILKSIEQAEAQAMKNGRKVIIEAEGLSEGDCAAVEKEVRNMASFLSLEIKKYHKIKVVFEVLQAGTGGDIGAVLSAKFEKTNISIWKYSKNIVKLRVVKVER